MHKKRFTSFLEKNNTIKIKTCAIFAFFNYYLAEFAFLLKAGGPVSKQPLTVSAKSGRRPVADRLAILDEHFN